MKKLIILPVLAVAFALAAVPAFARISHRDNGCCRPSLHQTTCCPEVNVNTNNEATVKTITGSFSNTGGNVENTVNVTNRFRGYGHGTIGGGAITTGDATAVTNSTADVNYNEITVAMPATAKVNVNTNNGATVNTIAGSLANTGHNTIGRGTIGSGAAGAQTTVMSVVNSNIITVE